MKNFLNDLKLFINWRLLILVVVLFFVPLTKSFNVFSNLDGLKFINIAKEWYGTPNTYYSYTLFPLYPTLIKFFAPAFGFVASSLFISHLFTLASIYMFQKLALLDYSKSSVKRGLVLLLCFPASFYLVSSYSESLFLFLCLTSVYFSRKKLYVFSGLVAALASYTRLAGLILWIVLIVEFVNENGPKIKNLLRLKTLTLFLPPLGFYSYFHYLQVNNSNLQSILSTLPNKFVFLHQVIFRYLKMLIFMDHNTPLFFIVLTESLVSFFALYLLFVTYKKLRPSYWLFFFFSFFIPTLSGDFVGMPRYLLVVFPIFYFLGDWIEHQHPYFQKLYYLTSYFLLFINLSFFVRGIYIG